MTELLFTMPIKRHDPAVKRSRWDNARWPIDRPALAALIDLGMSNAVIAGYFSVSPDDVHMLRDLYSLHG